MIFTSADPYIRLELIWWCMHWKIMSEWRETSRGGLCITTQTTLQSRWIAPALFTLVLVIPVTSLRSNVPLRQTSLQWGGLCITTLATLQSRWIAQAFTVTLDCTIVVHASTRHTSDVVNVLTLRYVKHPFNGSS